METSKPNAVACKRTGARHYFLGLALLGLLGAATGAVAVQSERSQQATAGIASLQETGKAFAHVNKQVSPAVVFVKVEKELPAGQRIVDGQRGLQPFDEDLLKRFFGDRLPDFKIPDAPRGDRRSIGQGSGFIISEDGHILTNNHVVEGASKLTVTLADGREFDGRIVGTDARSDVAVIKVDGRNLPVLSMGDSDNVQVGEWVLAVGSPFGLPGTVTSGIVSATGRSSVGIADYEDFIQTDAAINPGNSGGPLVNLNGEVIGINTAIASRTGAYNGVGFAIPINMARNICDQLIENGTVTRGHLGIMIQKLTPELAESFGLANAAGVLVGDVADDSPAKAAGLAAGDVITKFGGQKVRNLGAFRNIVAATAPGTEVEMVVVRSNEPHELSITVGRLPAANTQQAAAAADTVESLGFTVRPLSEELREKFNWQNESGVVIEHVDSGSQAALAGLEPGMLIEQVNQHDVHDVGEFRTLLDEAQENNRLLLRVKHGEYSRFVVLHLDN